MTDDVDADRREIRRLIENWALWRDARDWDRFRSIWHEDGRMMATWWQGPYEEFIRVSQEGWERGVRILHFLGGSSIDVNGEHAIAQTKMTITQRVNVHDVPCDVVCTGRFYDFFAYRDARWGLVLRQPIYEIDRLTPVSPVPVPPLDESILNRFPAGYRHLAYIQTLIGYTVKTDMPGLDGEELETLYNRGKEWLSRSPPRSGAARADGRLAAPRCQRR
jgi:hypothetical protein